MLQDADHGSCEVKVREEHQKKCLPTELRAFWMGSAVASVLAILVGWWKWHAGENPFNWDPFSDQLFFDLMEYPGTYTLVHTRAFFYNFPVHSWAYPMWCGVAYPPFAEVVMAPMYAARVPEVPYLAVTAGWLVVMVEWVRRALARSGIGLATAILMPLTLLAMSFPAVRLIHQGNIEIVLWIFTATGVWAFMRGWDDAAAILWALAGAMKLFPIVLLMLLLPRGRYRAFVVGAGTFAGVTVGSLWWLGPTMSVAWKGTLRNVFGYQTYRMTDWSGSSLATNHSAIELVKVAAQIFRFQAGHVVLLYYGCGAVAMALFFFLRLWKMPEANQLLAVTSFMLLFPAVSYYHTLVHLYAPLAVLGGVAIRAQRAGVKVPGLMSAMLLFVPLFASFTILTYPRELIFCGLVQSLILIQLFLMTLRYPFEVRIGEAG